MLVKRGSSSRRAVREAVTLLLTLLLVAGCLPFKAFAQAPTGSIEGVISDSSGAVIQGAKITVTDKSRGRTFSTTSGSKGTYAVSALEPGDYQVKVEAPSFKTGVLSVQVDVAKTVTGNVALEVGALSEVVSVTASEETAVDTNRNTISGVVNAKQIESLPINGRNFLDLAQLQPGVQALDGGGFDPTKNGYTGVSIAGGEGRTTRIQVDGIDITDETVGTTVSNLSMDSIQEFNISSAVLDPSTSLSNTGAISIATRSGTNGFHGSGFIFWRDHRFAARPGDHQDVTVIDASRVSEGKAAVLGKIPAQGFPRKFASTRDGRTIFLGNFASDSLEVIDADQLPAAMEKK